ncbi:MAG: fluoride efflux transporter CrcB [Alicyclobacillus sp.]|nr:fluoride efflux transporter CrcB [Alicyclobacillus sp.]
MSVLLVGVGGGLGAILRYLLGRALTRYIEDWPLATLLINVSGAMAFGCISMYLGRWVPHLAASLTLFFGVGMCGGYTTFSTFAYETWQLVQSKGVWSGGLYVAATAVFGLAGAGIGMYGWPSLGPVL